MVKFERAIFQADAAAPAVLVPALENDVRGAERYKKSGFECFDTSVKYEVVVAPGGHGDVHCRVRPV